MWNQSENQIELLLLRHGKTPSNEEHRYLGTGDEALSQTGRTELLQKKSQYQTTDILVTSPMKRCRQTAELLYPGKAYTVVSEWREMNFGRFEGKNYDDLKGDADYQNWIDSNGTLPFPEGESREQFIKRCEEGFLWFMKELPMGIKSAALVVHGGTIMALCDTFSAEGSYFDFQCENGGGYHCLVLPTEDSYQFSHLQKIEFALHIGK